MTKNVWTAAPYIFLLGLLLLGAYNFGLYVGSH